MPISSRLAQASLKQELVSKQTKPRKATRDFITKGFLEGTEMGVGDSSQDKSSNVVVCNLLGSSRKVGISRKESNFVVPQIIIFFFFSNTYVLM